MFDNMLLKHKQFALVILMVICLCLSIGSVTTCKFTKVEAWNITLKYGLFTYHGDFFGRSVEYDYFPGYNNNNNWYGGNGSKCYFYNDADNFNKTSTHKFAQATGILTVLMLIASVVLVSILKCHDFSPKLMLGLKLLLFIALAFNMTTTVLPQLKSFAVVLEDNCDRVKCDFSILGGWMSILTSVIIIVSLIFTCVCDFNKLPESDDDVDEKVDVEEEPDIHLPKEDEPEIPLPKEEEPEVYVAEA